MVFFCASHFSSEYLGDLPLAVVLTKLANEFISHSKDLKVNVHDGGFFGRKKRLLMFVLEMVMPALHQVFRRLSVHQVFVELHALPQGIGNSTMTMLMLVVVLICLILLSISAGRGF